MLTVARSSYTLSLNVGLDLLDHVCVTTPKSALAASPDALKPFLIARLSLARSKTFSGITIFTGMQHRHYRVNEQVVRRLDKLVSVKRNLDNEITLGI